MAISFRSIQFKLLRAFGLLFLITAITSMAALWFLHASIDISELKSDLDRVEQLTLKLIKRDKDFFAKETISTSFYQSGGQSELREEHEELVHLLAQETTALQQQLAQQDRQLLANMQLLQTQIQKYDSLYQTMLGELLQRGFIDEGMEGQMRAAAHALESEVEQTPYQADLLMLRRHEKDFLLRQQETYLVRFTQQATILKEKLSQNPVKYSAALDQLEMYQNFFLTLTQQIRRLGLEDQTGLKAVLNDLTDGLEYTIFEITRQANTLQTKRLNGIQTNLLVALALCLAASFVFAIRESRRISRPINRLRLEISDVIQGGFRKKVALTEHRSTEEVQELIATFTNMIHRIQEQLQTIENANEELTSQNEQLIIITDELQESNGVKDKFFSIIAHDLKSPIATLSSFLDLLIKFNDRLTKEETAQMAQEISLSLNNLSELLENLLEWSRAQMGTLEFQPTHVDLCQLLQKNVNLYRIRAREKAITLNLDAEDGLSARADQNMIDFVVRNLLGNAIKFTPAGGAVWLHAEVQQDSIQVRIQDTGVGIRPEDQAKLFRPDQHLTTRGTQNEKGTGLGLILCQEFVNRHGGQIWLESIPGQGTTFYFTLQPSMELV